MERAVPILPADDLSVARDFHVTRLGFRVVFEASEDGRTDRSASSAGRSG